MEPVMEQLHFLARTLNSFLNLHNSELFTFVFFTVIFIQNTGDLINFISTSNSFWLLATITLSSAYLIVLIIRPPSGVDLS